MVRISGQRGVPVTVIDGQAIVGYDRPRLEQLLTPARRLRLGAAIADAAGMAAKGRCTVAQGAYIGRITPGGVASRAGLQPGDAIVSFANQSVTDALALEGMLAGVRSGGVLLLTYVRGNGRYEAQLRF